MQSRSRWSKVIDTTLVVVVIIAALALSALPILLLLPIIMFKVVVSRDRIVVKAPPYEFNVHRDSVVEVSIADLGREPGLTPVRKILGYELVYKIGWYRLRNGSTAFLAITSTNKPAVVFRLKENYYLIVVPKDLGSFIDLLRDLGWQVVV